MDDRAFELVRDYIRAHIDKSLGIKKFDLFIVSKTKCLRHWKYTICTDIPDDKHYELIFNGEKKEWYLDVYKRLGNQCIIEDKI